jgi:hypothetical protein
LKKCLLLDLQQVRDEKDYLRISYSHCFTMVTCRLATLKIHISQKQNRLTKQQTVTAVSPE